MSIAATTTTIIPMAAARAPFSTNASRCCGIISVGLTPFAASTTAFSTNVLKMTWSIVGISTCLLIGVFAAWRSRQPAGGHDGEEYGMTPSAHRRYVAIELLLAALFVGTLLARADWLAVWLLAFAVLADVFYLTSFLRTWSEE